MTECNFNQITFSHTAVFTKKVLFLVILKVRGHTEQIFVTFWPKMLHFIGDLFGHKIVRKSRSLPKLAGAPKKCMERDR